MNNLQYFFDREADVLYVSKGQPRSDAESDEVGDGIIARLDPVTREIVGFTILNFLSGDEPTWGGLPPRSSHRVGGGRPVCRTQAEMTPTNRRTKSSKSLRGAALSDIR